jgi:hypothetical protein
LTDMVYTLFQVKMMNLPYAQATAANIEWLSGIADSNDETQVAQELQEQEQQPKKRKLASLEEGEANATDSNGREC